MSRIRKNLKKRNKARYNLHYRIKTKRPDDAELLDPVQRSFSQKPTSPEGLKLVREYGYNVLIPAF